MFGMVLATHGIFIYHEWIEIMALLFHGENVL